MRQADISRPLCCRSRPSSQDRQKGALSRAHVDALDQSSLLLACLSNILADESKPDAARPKITKN
jgi:hypothetical protein